MSENPIFISNLNDFIFCPASIYFHMLDEQEEKLIYQNSEQLNGTDAHKKPDSATYSSKRSVLQGVSVYCEKYDIIGKIDTFDIKKGILTERKKKIKTVYNGYVFQLFAQYFALSEMGYVVNSIRLYSMDDNKVYTIKTPTEDKEMFSKFEELVFDIHQFSFEKFRQSNISKCQHCIYEPLCSYSALKG